MNILEEFDRYKYEIELNIKQNNSIEVDLYQPIGQVLKNRKNYFNRLSIRDVSSRRRTLKGNAGYDSFFGAGGFPDFLVLKPDFLLPETNKDSEYIEKNILGAVEIKFINKFEKEKKIDSQIRGHIKSFHKVIYTDGLVWRFYDEIEEPKWEICIGKVGKSGISWDKNRWEQLMEKLEEIAWETKELV